MKIAVIPPSIFEYQPNALLDQAAPVNGTWYPVLATTRNVRINGITFAVQTTGENLELRIIIDGRTLTVAVAGAVAGTSYLVSISHALAGDVLTVGTTAYSYYRAFIIEGKNVSVDVRKTTANGAGNLQANCSYNKKVPA